MRTSRTRSCSSSRPFSGGAATADEGLSVRLLLIEDDQAYQCAMATHLRALPEVDAVAVACDGEQGLEILEREGMDVVLLDLLLPGIGGLATCSQISAKQTAPVLMLTSQDDPPYGHRHRRLRLVPLMYRPNSTASLPQRSELEKAQCAATCTCCCRSFRPTTAPRQQCSGWLGSVDRISAGGAGCRRSREAAGSTAACQNANARSGCL